MSRKERQKLINETIAKNLRVQRAIQNLSQKQLAYRVGLDQSSVARIETCKRKMLAEELPLFAEALNVDISELLG